MSVLNRYSTEDRAVSWAPLRAIGSRFTALAVVPLAVLCTGPGRARDTTAYHISGITAHLYYDDSGTFSPNVIDNPDFKLWNVIIGGGSAVGYSNATLVKVGVSGTANVQGSN